ncbi:MAG: hypothetical protein HY699_00845 [Deltaproteobacteria bacterium]|nr:hypothetical protein [Deltaproteobacteria bacterium]
MAGDIHSDEVAAIVEHIGRGDDPYVVPKELVEEPESPPPLAAQPAAEQEIVNKSLYNLIKNMGVGEKIKLALKGNRDARTILIREANRLIPRFVLQNPRITDDEIVGIARNRNVDAELLRIVSEHKEWGRNQQVRSALVSNPKTPVAVALRFVNSLTERELRLLAKSKNITSAVAGAAKRILILRTTPGH